MIKNLTILSSGFVKTIPNGLLATSTSILLETHNEKIIVDPGISKEIFNRLAEFKIDLKEINYIFLTHHHLDHSFNSFYFPYSKILDGFYLYENERLIEHKGKVFTDIEIIHTPGHTSEHSSLSIIWNGKNTLIAGDFVWYADEVSINNMDELINLKDPFAENLDLLIKKRKEIIPQYKFIIPGHGRPIEL